MLRERFATEHIDEALAHATRYGAFSHESVLHILEARHQPRTLDEYVSEQTAHWLENELGIRQTAPRDLAEYDRLPPSLVNQTPGTDGADNEETTTWQPRPTPVPDAPEALPTEPHPTKNS